MDHIDHFVETATRQFTDRQKPRALFEDSIKSFTHTKCISYYGIGGIGKTRLLSKLMQEAKFHDINSVCIHVDFQESYFRNIGEFLNLLKSQILKHEKMDFYSFDFAYAVYWARTHAGEMPFEKGKGVIEENHILFEVFQELDGIPFAQVIPRAINLMNKIPKQAKKMSWWNTEGKILAAQISVIDDIQALRDVLLNVWVKDVISHFSTQQKKLVFFFDSFESVDLNRLPRIKTLIYKFTSYPVLFVIGSRNKLGWSSEPGIAEIDEHIVGELSEKDMRSFLDACHIKCLGDQCSIHRNELNKLSKTQCESIHEDIIRKIMNVSNGIPIYLDLMVDTYMQIKRNGYLPSVDDFSNNRNEIVPILLKNFNDAEQSFLQLLSFPNYWNFDIVKLLSKEYSTTIPLNQISRFYDYSFIHEHDQDFYTMQIFIREALQKQLGSSNHAVAFTNDVHQTLMNYYIELLNDHYTFEHFLEAAFHAEHGLSQSEFENWLKNSIEHLLNKGFVDGLSHYLQQLLSRDIVSTTVSAELQVTMLECLLQIGQFTQILEASNDIINFTNEAAREDLRAKVQYIIGSAHYAHSEYDQAVRFFKLASSTPQIERLTIDSLMKIGKISVTISDFETARVNYLQASQHIHTLLKNETHDPTLLSLAGQCFEKLGELLAHQGKRNEQLRLYKQSIHYIQQAVEDETHPYYLHHLTLLGFSTKRLAEAFEHTGGDVMATFKQAIRIYKKVLAHTPQSVDTLEKLGHAAADLLRVANASHNEQEIQRAFEEANNAFSSVIDLAPNKGGSLNRLSSIHLEMAKYFMDKHSYAQAKIHLDKAHDYYDLTIKRAKNYAYAAAKKKAIDEVYSRYYRSI